LDKKEIVVLLFSSAAIGAAVSAVLTAFTQWRERVARQKELLLKLSVELSKTYVERIASLSKTFLPLPEGFLKSWSVLYKGVRMRVRIKLSAAYNR
jgi:hypothetical protein